MTPDGALLAAVEQSKKSPEAVTRWAERGQALFSKGASGAARPVPPNLRAELRATTARLRRLAVARNCLDAARARTSTRDWAKARREHTRHLIELGGLVLKADLAELLDGDRATLLGALLDVAGQLRGTGAGDADPAHLRARWRRAGMRAFEADKDVAGQQGGQDGKEVPTGSAASSYPGSPLP